MKLLRKTILLNEGIHVVDEVPTPAFLKDPNTNRFYVGVLDVVGNVGLGKRMNGTGGEMGSLPVQFGAVGGDFYCNDAGLTTLEGAPGSVGGSFYCHENRLTTLEGAPGTVGRNFWFDRNRLTSLVGVHRIIRRINGILYIRENPIESGGIGLILVEGLTRIIADQPAFEIIEQYLGQGMRGLLRCQEALHEAGYGEFAKL